MTPLPLLPSHSDPLTLTARYPSRPPTAHAAVLGALRAGATTVDEIRTALGWTRRSRRQVARSIEWLALRGFVEPVAWRAT